MNLHTDVLGGCDTFGPWIFDRGAAMQVCVARHVVHTVQTGVCHVLCRARILLCAMVRNVLCSVLFRMCCCRP